MYTVSVLDLYIPVIWAIMTYPTKSATKPPANNPSCWKEKTMDQSLYYRKQIHSISG